MLMENYKVVAPIQVRFRDSDAMGHVNNAVYLSYLEYARMEYAKEVLGITRFADIDFIVARAEIDYRSQTRIGDALEVGIRVSRIGRASFDFDYRVEEPPSRRLVAEAKTVQVCYDYKAGKVKGLSEDFLKKVREHDGLA